MTKTSVKSLGIAVDHDKPNLSKGQKAFNALIKQIEKRRARLSAWEAVIPPFHQKFTGEYALLERTLTDLQIRLAHRLDQACDQKGLTKAERRTASGLVAEMASDLFAQRDDPELKALYNKHSGSDYDRETASELEEMKWALEDMLGVELGDDLDMSSPEAVYERVQAEMEQRQAQDFAESQAREEQRAKRKKTPKQIAAEARVEAEQAQLSLSIREVYRKLASALHPDREADPLERDRKTSLMQRVNQAYGNNNLLQLLELQLELEHIDQHAINNISEDRLKHYNTILKEQIGELDQEIMHVEAEFKHRYGIAPFAIVSPGSIERNLISDIASVRKSIRALERDLLAFEDIKQLKLWLRRLEREAAMNPFDDMSF
ncbi:hypothetical protein SBC1_14060 [Caballeronia sp. SBC1]|uniref:molecular chaperone DnaJ n=1 Tax=unclassified Caballeronia TaxID=2646786 RepID=UPI0013E1491A|nr:MULTISPECIES: molecular chaperone DnaJ [unclassified Caballeronia]QIE23521.1 hypothetical protein SBC2_15450 [Caballeronia sp. SBC2]QIN61416.1 hypothetical protein SBC1_14060 [Caballeronia sp. SBC1]